MKHEPRLTSLEVTTWETLACHRWDTIECEVVDWIQLAQDRVQWQTFCEYVSVSSSYAEAGNFMTSYITTNCSRTIYNRAYFGDNVSYFMLKVA
jgi:hypothetical protein